MLDGLQVAEVCLRRVPTSSLHVCCGQPCNASWCCCSACVRCVLLPARCWRSHPRTCSAAQGAQQGPARLRIGAIPSHACFNALAVPPPQYKDPKKGMIGVEGFGRLLDSAGRLVRAAGHGCTPAWPACSAAARAWHPARWPTSAVAACTTTSSLSRVLCLRMAAFSAQAATPIAEVRTSLHRYHDLWTPAGQSAVAHRARGGRQARDDSRRHKRRRLGGLARVLRLVPVSCAIGCLAPCAVGRLAPCAVGCLAPLRCCVPSLGLPRACYC